eukprot:6483765-Amphidinium_carterae.1
MPFFSVLGTGFHPKKWNRIGRRKGSKGAVSTTEGFFSRNVALHRFCRTHMCLVANSKQQRCTCNCNPSQTSQFYPEPTPKSKAQKLDSLGVTVHITYF